MRFLKGSNVEVLKKSEGPSGSWWCAEIIKGNGHYYHVKYNRSPDGTLLERVPRNAMRPLPPIGTTENWILGDIVEVFDNNSWKIAKVSKVVGGHYFLVRLLGSCQEFRVHKTNLRVRQSWQNNQWIMIGKLSQNSGDGNPGKPSSTKYCHESSLQLPLPDMKVKAHVQEEGLPVQGNCALVEADIPGISSRRSMKRGPQLSSLIEHSLPKKRVIHKDDKLQRVFPLQQSPRLEKVDAVASPRTMLGEKYMHASFNSRMIGFSEVDVEESREVGYFQRSLEFNDDAESVASCSNSSHDPYKFFYHSRTTHRQDSNSDAESSSSSGWVNGRQSSFLTNEEVAEDTRLKLEAFTPCFQSPKDDTWGLLPSHEGSGEYLHPDSLQIRKNLEKQTYVR